MARAECYSLCAREEMFSEPAKSPEGAPCNSHGRQAVDLGNEIIRAPKVRHFVQAGNGRNGGPSGLAASNADVYHGLTAAATECRAFGALDQSQ